MFKKSTMSLALTAAMIGGVAVTQQASANLDVDGGLTAADPFVSNNALGQALVYPYYTVRGGKKSIINIFNTSNKTIVAKVRFHESHNSRDVLDFNLILSPFDKWSGTLENGASGALFKSRDNTCTVPRIPSTGVALNNVAYTGANQDQDLSDTGSDRTREGYVEVIAMGQADAGDAGGAVGPHTALNVGNVAYLAEHVAGMPRDATCNIIKSRFEAGSGATAPTVIGGTLAGNVQMNVAAAGGSGNPAAAPEFTAITTGFNPLRGALTIVDDTNGVGFGISALAIADWTDPAAPDLNIAALATTATMLTSQTYPYFLEPTLASRDGLWTTTGLPVVEAAIAATTVINEWSNNPVNGAATDWVIQFPTKGFHVDIPYSPGTTTGCFDGNVQAAVNLFRGNAPANSVPNVPACTAGVAPFTNRFTAVGSAVTISAKTVDKEEASAVSSGVSFSPAQPTASTSIPWESNVVTFGGNSVLSSDSPELILDPVGSIGSGETNGQAFVTFAAGALPVIGFVAKERDQGGTSNYGQIMTHSFK